VTSSEVYTRRVDAFLWAVVVEGATDRFLGRPRECCPYAPGYDATEAWQYVWDESDWLFEIRGADEVRRWLREAA